MKKIFQTLACGLLLLGAAACSQGAAAVDKAYQQACEAAPAEKIATTLCNGEINCYTLTSDEAAKLGAVIEYLQNHGMYSANFEAQVDMYQFGKLLEHYREIENKQTSDQRIQKEEYLKDLNLQTTK